MRTTVSLLGVAVVMAGAGFWFGSQYAVQPQKGQAEQAIPAEERTEITTEVKIEKVTFDSRPAQVEQQSPDAVAQSSESQAGEQALQQQISQLQQRLQQQDKQLARVMSRYQAAAEVIKQADLALPESISMQQASELLPAPFDEVIANASARMTDLFLEMQQQPLDYDWATRMQQQISDFFITHQYSDLVQLQAVTCQASICEIRGFDHSAEHWSKVAADLQQQPWWAATNTNSVSGNNDQQGFYFYVLAEFRRPG